MDFYSVFTQILDLSNSKVEKWTVIAAFVTEDGKVLSVASGVKCLPINKLFTPDRKEQPCYHDLIRDYHAEVLARRALIRYCLLNPSQLPQMVWLFTTQVPCEDASIVAEPEAQLTLGGRSPVEAMLRPHIASPVATRPSNGCNWACKTSTSILG